MCLESSISSQQSSASSVTNDVTPESASENGPSVLDADDEMSETQSTISTSTDGDVCECPCCALCESLNQPNDVGESKRTYKYNDNSLQARKTYSRSLQTSWYKRHPWITVCDTTYKIFCHICRQAKYQGLLVFSKRQVQSFIDKGYCNWKNALSKLAEHEKSEMHKEAVLKLAAKSSAVNVGAMLSKEHASIQDYHQTMLFKLLSSIRYMAAQGLALRGHTEKPDCLEGNLYNLLLLRAEDIPGMKGWVEKKRVYFS